MRKKINTKYGLVHEDHNGYYYTSDNRRLHRVIWEDFYGQKIPDGMVIHHKDMNRKNNDISNLQLMTSEAHTELHKEQFFRDKTTTGIWGVCKKPCPKCKQGFAYHYTYKDKDGKRKAIVSTDLKKLLLKVQLKNLPIRTL